MLCKRVVYWQHKVVLTSLKKLMGVQSTLVASGNALSFQLSFFLLLKPKRLGRTKGGLRKMDTTKPRRHFKEKPKLTCHDCGLEDINACSEGKHQSATPDKLPCAYCQRNPEVDEEVFDFFSETWVIAQLSNGTFEAIIEDPDRHERMLLNIMQHCLVVYSKP
jgi:hypothetical protein